MRCCGNDYLSCLGRGHIWSSCSQGSNCGCCSAWVEILRADGFEVTVEESEGATLAQYKRDSGYPTGNGVVPHRQVAGYMIEGHVPPMDIRRLLAERPEAVGLAVPGMPYGSPGMGRKMSVKPTMYS